MNGSWWHAQFTPRVKCTATPCQRIATGGPVVNATATSLHPRGSEPPANKAAALQWVPGPSWGLKLPPTGVHTDLKDSWQSTTGGLRKAEEQPIFPDHIPASGWPTLELCQTLEPDSLITLPTEVPSGFQSSLRAPDVRLRTETLCNFSRPSLLPSSPNNGNTALCTCDTIIRGTGMHTELGKQDRNAEQHQDKT